VISTIFGNDLDQIFNLGLLFLRKSNYIQYIVGWRRCKLLFGKWK